MIRRRSEAVLVAVAALALAVAGAGCSRDDRSDADDDGGLVVQAETETRQPAAEEPEPETKSEEAATTPDAAEQHEPREAAGREEEGEMPDEPRIAIKTTKGDIIAKLYPNEAPKTVANFLSLVEEGYYDDMVWHRVEPGFVIQTGNGPSRPNIPDEVNSHKHRGGALAMAKLGSPSADRLSLADSASTQFYITMCNARRAEHLNAEYTVFGQVIEGMDVAREITTRDKIETIEVLSGDD
jgi:peptidyl-prolyl cis-trans isomerase B (cyclophilin B)